MEPSHPEPANRLRQFVRSRGGNIVCPVCEGEEFVHEEAAILGGGSERGYGTRRLQRVQLVCENCTYVMSFDLSKLLAAQGSDGPDY